MDEAILGKNGCHKPNEENGGCENAGVEGICRFGKRCYLKFTDAELNAAREGIPAVRGGDTAKHKKDN